MSDQIKSKERVQKHGEVFTSEREVKAKCDLVESETKRINSIFLLLNSVSKIFSGFV